MQQTQHRRASGPVVVRSAVSNGSRLLIAADGRSSIARRFRDIIADIGKDLGGLDGLSEAQRQLVRRAATLAIQCEMAESDSAEGKPFHLDAYLVAANAQRRILATLGIKAVGAKPKVSALQEHLARNYAPKPPTEAVAA